MWNSLPIVLTFTNSKSADLSKQVEDCFKFFEPFQKSSTLTVNSRTIFETKNTKWSVSRKADAPAFVISNWLRIYNLRQWELEKKTSFGPNWLEEKFLGSVMWTKYVATTWLKITTIDIKICMSNCFWQT